MTTKLVVTIGTGWENENATFLVDTPYPQEELNGGVVHEIVRNLNDEYLVKFVKIMGRYFPEEALDLGLIPADPYIYYQVFEQEKHGDMYFPYADTSAIAYKVRDMLND